MLKELCVSCGISLQRTLQSGCVETGEPSEGLIQYKQEDNCNILVASERQFTYATVWINHKSDVIIDRSRQR